MKGSIMSGKNLVKIMALVAVLGLGLQVSHAQWSSDPLQNLGIAVANGDQTLPKIAATSDNGCYISWFDGRSGSYCMYLQRLNSAGEPQWATNGLVISSHPQETALVDYDLAVDPGDNAVIVFSDLRHGSANDLDVVAYQISPVGSFLWGADGISLSSPVNTEFEAVPKVAVTPAGNYVIAWVKFGTEETLGLQKLSGSGQKLWGDNGITLTGAVGERLSGVDLVATEYDNVILVWKNSTGPIWSPTTSLYTQKLDADHVPLWNPSGVVIYNLGHMSAWTYPLIVADGVGGAYYGWCDSPQLTNFFANLGHVEFDGSLSFPVNGIPASTNPATLHMDPTLSFVAEQDAIYMFWIEKNASQTQSGIYGQKFAVDGFRFWGDSGQEFIPLSNDDIICLRALPGGGYHTLAWLETRDLTNVEAKALRSNEWGLPIWGPIVFSAASLGGKGGLQMAMNPEQRAFLAWYDSRTDFADLYAQNVNSNGTLGNPLPPPVEVTMTPQFSPIIIFPGGGDFSFTADLVNISGLPQTCNAWIMQQMAGNPWMGPMLGPLSLNLPAGASLSRTRTQYVPATADPGDYYYCGFVGEYPNTVWDSSGFGYTKLLGDGEPGVKEWANFGESFDVASEAPLPETSVLLGSYPNPFNPETALNYQLTAYNHVRLRVYDAAGKEVATLVNGWQEAGVHEVNFDASGLPSGMYFARLTAGGDTQTQKLVLLK
ncbi:MAG: T9SS C-terminal target domain-containing protein [Candidatus Zixiibacteriota bacterium]|nr:MAG: T9SS C-terminal target domain-containing protein [candidate division Zixibacteria bacterium]